jgi:hypothetical protein
MWQNPQINPICGAELHLFCCSLMKLPYPLSILSRYTQRVFFAIALMLSIEFRGFTFQKAILAVVEECSQAYFIEKLFPPFRLILRATAELSTIHTNTCSFWEKHAKEWNCFCRFRALSEWNCFRNDNITWYI